MIRPTITSLALFFAACTPNLSAAAPQNAALPPAPKADIPAAKPGETRTAVLAAGCFWCVEAVFEQLEGVTEVVSGYAGDSADKARYDLVSSGDTRHAEVVQIKYDHRITYGQLLRVLYLTSDPTTKDAQGPDHGPQYRHVIFYGSDEEKKVAEAYIAQLNAAKIYGAPIVTTLEKLDAFYPAEKYHQDFVALHPDHPYVRAWAVGKVTKLHQKLPELLKKKK